MSTEKNLIADVKKLVPELKQKHGSSNDALIPILQGVQERFKYVPKVAISEIANELSVYESHVYGVITFYAQFRLNPVGENIIKICKGTACHVGGAETIADVLEDFLGIKEDETTKDKKFTLECVACIGCCSLAPVIMINDKIYGHLTKDKIRNVLDEY